MNKIHTPEHAHTINGVEGRMFNRVIDDVTGLFRNQRFIARRPISGYATGATITVEIRFDDECKNGHHSFAITAEIKEPRSRDFAACGCLHDDIEKAFPELAPLIKWHLFDTTGPMHYVANTCYLAGNLDSSGLAQGESRQIINGSTKQPAWRQVCVDQNGNEIEFHKLQKYADGEKPSSVYTVEWKPWCRAGEGKARQLDAARRCAVWPDATDAQLSVPRAELEAALLARLPALVADFNAAMESCGFLFAQPVSTI